MKEKSSDNHINTADSSDVVTTQTSDEGRPADVVADSNIVADADSLACDTTQQTDSVSNCINGAGTCVTSADASVSMVSTKTVVTTESVGTSRNVAETSSHLSSTVAVDSPSTECRVSCVQPRVSLDGQIEVIHCCLSSLVALRCFDAIGQLIGKVFDLSSMFCS